LVVAEEENLPSPGGWRCPHPQAGASNIEATAYLLLNYVARSDIVKSMDVAKWIVRQRNANGGFSSTHVCTVSTLISYKHI
jgi:CD109 antigen